MTLIHVTLDQATRSRKVRVHYSFACKNYIIYLYYIIIIIYMWIQFI